MQTQSILWMACSFTRYWNDSQIWLFNWRRTCQEGGGSIGHADFKNTSVFSKPFQRVCFLPPKFLNPGMLSMLVDISPVKQLYGLHITGQGCNLGITGSDSLGYLTWRIPNFGNFTCSAFHGFPHSVSYAFFMHHGSTPCNKACLSSLSKRAGKNASFRASMQKGILDERQKEAP